MKQVLGAEVSVEDPGFRHGLGVFETVLVRESKALFAEWHWESLRQAAQALGLETPISFPLDLPPGDDGLWRWFHTDSGIRATWEEGLSPIPESYTLRVSSISHPSQAWPSRYKTLSYLANVQARRMAGGDEALLLNEHLQVATGAMSNIFWVREGTLYTPSPDCGCREGVLRRWILEQGGFDCQQGAFSLEEMMEAQEIFLTNSRIGIMPVRDLEGRELPRGALTQALQKRYSACLVSADE